jgi:hypothetical protein
MKVYACLLLNEAEAAKARQAGADTVVCNGIAPGLGDLPFRIVDANEYRIEGSHRAFDANLRVYENEMAKAWPAAFSFRGTPLWDAYLKALLWSNRKIAYLEEAISQLGPDVQVVHRIPLHSGSRWRCALAMAKAMLRKVKGGAYQVPVLPIPQEARLGFLIEDLFEFSLVQRLQAAFPKESVLVLPPHHRFKKAEIDRLRAEGYTVVLCQAGKWSHLPFTLPFRFGGSAAWFVQQMLSNEPGISACLSWGRALIDSPLRVLVTVAQENTPYGHILGRMAEAGGKRVINVMNGIKFGEANDRLVQFQCWMMWDEAMQRLLHRHSGLPMERLYPGGNLTRDNIRGHEYSGHIPVSEEERATKRIISIISTRDLRRDKVTALSTLYDWAAGQSGLILLYRPHPSEKEDSYYLPAGDSGIDIRMVKPEAAVAKKSLLDQLMSSDLTINFGSTVSIEALWMKARCITFEMKPFSWLYCVDAQTLLHINSPDALRAELEHCHFHPKANSADPGAHEPYSWQQHADYIRPFLQA